MKTFKFKARRERSYEEEIDFEIELPDYASYASARALAQEFAASAKEDDRWQPISDLDNISVKSVWSPASADPPEK